jgi:hypothetical protein
MNDMIGRADHLSRDNRLDLSGVGAYQQPDEMAVTLKRHIRQLWSFSINPDFRRRDAEHHWRNA